MHELLRFLIACVVINYGILMIWFAAFTFAHDQIYRLHSHWFKLSPEAFDNANYIGMAVYKIGIMLLNLVPLIALHFVHW